MSGRVGQHVPAGTRPAAGGQVRPRATLDLAWGLGLADTLVDDSKRRGRVIAQWAVMLDTAVAAPLSGRSHRDVTLATSPSRRSPDGSNRAARRGERQETGPRGPGP